MTLKVRPCVTLCPHIPFNDRLGLFPSHYVEIQVDVVITVSSATNKLQHILEAWKYTLLMSYKTTCVYIILKVKQTNLEKDSSMSSLILISPHTDALGWYSE